MNRVAPLAALVAFALTLGGCATRPKIAAPSVTGAPSYRLGAGDRLRIDTYNEPKLSGEFLVDGDGKVAFPLIGRIDANDQTPSQLSDAIAAALNNGVLLHANVSVQVLGYRPVYVLGEVVRPGQYPFAEKMTIYSLVAQAGGFTYRASRKAVGLRRDGEDAEHEVQVNGATAVKPGDTIRILERLF